MVQKIYVLDNWLAHPIHKKVDESLKGARWGKSNEVRGDDPTGLPMHQFWGASMYCDDNWSDEVDNGIILWSKYLNERVISKIKHSEKISEKNNAIIFAL
mgnify:CR=1 FL=1